MAPPQPWLKPLPMAPMEEPVPIMVAPTVQKIRKKPRLPPPVRKLLPSFLPRLVIQPTKIIKQIHAIKPPINNGMYLGSNIVSFPP